MIKRALCFLGIHKFEQTPSFREPVKETGLRLALFICRYVQKGIKKCVRPGCSKTQTVWREIRGVPAFDDFSCHTAYPWRVYSTRMEQMKKTEQAIDLLPNAFCKPTPFD